MGLKYKVNSNTKLYLPSGSLTDQSVNGNNASNVGATLSKSGRFGDAYYLDGNDYLTIPDTDSLSFTNGANDLPFTINCIVNYISGSATCIICKAAGKAPDSYTNLEWNAKITGGLPYLLLYSPIPGDDTLEYAFIYKIATTPIPNGWNNIVYSYSGGGINGINIYVNGSIQTLTSGSSGTYTKMANTISTIDIAVSNRLTSGGISYYTGYIDSIIIENIEWTAKQVHNFYQHNFKPYYQ